MLVSSAGEALPLTFRWLNPILYQGKAPFTALQSINLPSNLTVNSLSYYTSGNSLVSEITYVHVNLLPYVFVDCLSLPLKYELDHTKARPSFDHHLSSSCPHKSLSHKSCLINVYCSNEWVRILIQYNKLLTIIASFLWNKPSGK